MARGAKTGGRKKGSKNKATVEREAGIAEITAKAKAEGITPLEVMVGAMREAWGRNDKEAAARFAKDAAPYMHPRLAAVEHTGKDGKDLIPASKDAARALLDFLRDNAGSSE
jgi:hypothetical protein